MAVYYVSHVGGLGEVVLEELREKVPEGRVLRSEYGRQYLELGRESGRLLGLRTIENAVVVVREFEAVQPGAQWLEELETALAATDLGPALAVVQSLRPVGERPRFRVTAERSGVHDFRSMEAAGAAGASIVAGMGWPVALRDYELEVLLEIEQERATVGVRLSPEALHKRSRVVHPRVTLNPTVAAAMVRLSEPAPRQVVVDPLCGGGTILTERYEYDPEVTLVAADLFIEKVALARQNFQALGVPVQLLQADVRRLPLGNETVDRFISNPPWGNLVGDRQLNRRLYPWLLGHMRRCLKPGGLMVLLTSERRLVQSFVDKHADVQQVSVQRLTVGGLRPSLLVLRRQTSG